MKEEMVQVDPLNNDGQNLQMVTQWYAHEVEQTGLNRVQASTTDVPLPRKKLAYALMTCMPIVLATTACADEEVKMTDQEECVYVEKKYEVELDCDDPDNDSYYKSYKKKKSSSYSGFGSSGYSSGG
ncbi:hypothetical protein [Paenibacillus sp. 481]|uniref:hypothetical protein n=1 Tax=Paenibacillus sp. 481 TaxID=2835869 RepID=UPI001E2B3476|nr:hypothetical protein [Paenibacillus sp. 481]UHA72826.1 hypothetical protein KIK04_19695 [Paenibacillus sp. 481]